MKRTYPASIQANAAAKPAKRSRKKLVPAQQYFPDGPTEPNNTVRLVTVSNKTSKGRFGVRNSTINVEKPVEPLPVPLDAAEVLPEDPNAFDAAQWHDMLEDNVIQVAKTKRKQRNDSVRTLFLLDITTLITS